jgi:hypothetical protein
MIAIFYINPQGNFLVNDQIDCTHYITDTLQIESNSF